MTNPLITKDQMLKLITAIEKGSFHFFEDLIASDINWLITPLIDKDSREALIIHYASMYGNLKIVQLVLSLNPDQLNALSTFNHTPLQFAAARGHVDVADYLLSLNACLTIGTHYPGSLVHGYFPIHWGVARGHFQVVQCLMDHGAATDVRVSDKNLHLIHIASLQGHLRMVQFLLEKSPLLLNEIDALKQTPVLWAAKNGHYHIVQYLISKNANIDIATYRPNHESHGFTPLMWASKNGFYEAANALILKKSETESNEKFVPLVRSAEQALDLMTLQPSFIHFFLNNPRIYNLIKKSNCKITKDSIHWYKLAGRKPSLFVDINIKSETSTMFKPTKELGRGSYGIVRLFQAADGQEIAVKSLVRSFVNIQWFMSNKQELSTKREAEFNQKAYPNDPISEIFGFDIFKDSQSIYTNRFVMSYIKGEKAGSLIPKIKTAQQLAIITLKIALELDRIHQIGIIHSDLHFANILISYDEHENVLVRLIDFGLSSYRTENTVKTWVSQLKSWIPPELCGNASNFAKPHPNQDIYSLGNTLKLILEKHPCYQGLMKLFPSIQTFISTSQDIIPTNRPSLTFFCQQLSNELRPTIKNGLVPFWQTIQTTTASETDSLLTKSESTARCKHCTLM